MSVVAGVEQRRNAELTNVDAGNTFPHKLSTHATAQNRSLPVHDGNKADNRQEEEDICVNFCVQFVMALRHFGSRPVIRFCR